MVMVQKMKGRKVIQWVGCHTHQQSECLGLR